MHACHLGKVFIKYRSTPLYKALYGAEVTENQTASHKKKATTVVTL